MKKEWNKNVIAGIVISVIGFFIIYLISGVIAEIPLIILLVIRGEFTEEMKNKLLIDGYYLYGFLVFMFVSIIYVINVEKRSLSSIGLLKTNAVIHYLKGLIIGSVLSIIIIVGSIITGMVTVNGVKQVNWLMVIVFIIGFLIQGLGLEIMCRGYLLTSLNKKTTPFWAIMINSLLALIPYLASLLNTGILFGVIGFTNMMLFFVFISLIVLVRKNIFEAAAIHGAWNIILSLFYGRGLNGANNNTIAVLNIIPTNRKSILTGGVHGLETGLIMTVTLVISVGILAFAVSKKNYKL